MTNLNWLYGTWQFNINVTDLSIVPQQLKDNYILNICFINSTTYYVKFTSDKNGNLDWFGPYIVNKNIDTITPVDNIITILYSDVNPPDISNITPWPLPNVKTSDYFINPILIDTVKYTVGINFQKNNYIKWGEKGCYYKNIKYPEKCFPEKDLISGNKIDLNDIQRIPAICPLFNPNTQSIKIPPLFWYILIATVSVICFLIILNIIFYKKLKSKHI